MRRDESQSYDESRVWGFIAAGCLAIFATVRLGCLSLVIGCGLIVYGISILRAINRNFARRVREKRLVVNLGKIADIDQTNRDADGALIPMIEEVSMGRPMPNSADADLPTIVEEPLEPLLLTDAEATPTEPLPRK